MPVDYDFLKNAAPSQSEQNSDAGGKVTVTIRVDADCLLQCDGEFVDVQLVAGNITKVELPLGHHILEFIKPENTDIKLEREVNFPEMGKSYVVLVNEMKAAEEVARKKAEEERLMKEAEVERKRKEAEEKKRKAEEAARKKAEEDRLRKEAEAKAKADAERKKAEEDRLRKEAEAKAKAEAERKRKEAEDQKRKAEEEHRIKEAEDAKRRAAERAKRKAEEEIRKKKEKLTNRNTTVGIVVAVLLSILAGTWLAIGMKDATTSWGEALGLGYTLGLCIFSAIVWGVLAIIGEVYEKKNTVLCRCAFALSTLGLICFTCFRGTFGITSLFISIYVALFIASCVNGLLHIVRSKS